MPNPTYNTNIFITFESIMRIMSISFLRGSGFVPPGVGSLTIPSGNNVYKHTENIIIKHS
jgi:hypothetical protein